jgi:hypothetical protein
VAIVKLKKDHYAHKSYGKIYTPVFEVQEWVSMDGEPEEPDTAPVASQIAGRRRRSA